MYNASMLAASEKGKNRDKITFNRFIEDCQPVLPP